MESYREQASRVEKTGTASDPRPDPPSVELLC